MFINLFVCGNTHMTAHLFPLFTAPFLLTVLLPVSAHHSPHRPDASSLHSNPTVLPYIGDPDVIRTHNLLIWSWGPPQGRRAVRRNGELNRGKSCAVMWVFPHVHSHGTEPQNGQQPSFVIGMSRVHGFSDSLFPILLRKTRGKSNSTTSASLNIILN